MEFAISQPKLVQLPRNEKQTYSRPQMWPSGLTLAMTLTLNFKVKYDICYICQPIMVRVGRNEKQIYRLKFRPQMWPSNLTLVRDNHAGSVYRLKSRPQMWPIGLTLTLTFEFSRSNLTLTFDHTHGLKYGFSWSNFEIAVSQNGSADLHWTNVVEVGHSWPWPWPFGDQGQV